MLEFTFVGFNIRQWPWSGVFNVDDTGWDLNDEVDEIVKGKFNIKENEFQLLMPKNNTEMNLISEYILSVKNANIAAIEIPTSIVKLNDERTGYETCSNNIDLTNYLFRGFDVSDIDGFFSGLHHPEIKKIHNGLFLPDDYISALEAANYLSFLDRNHSPFTLTKISTLK